MKKVLLLGVLLVSVFLTGCDGIKDIIPGGKDSKELVCSQKVQTVEVIMISDFEGDVMKYFGLKYDMDLSAYNAAQINLIKDQDMCGVVEKSMASYTNSLTNCKQKIENKKLIITADFDLNKLMSSDIKKEANINEVKKALEKQNYSCVVQDK